MSSAEGRRKKVLILTERFSPEPNFITADVAARLARDADVTVIAPHPSYPRGKFYKGTSYWRPVKTREGGFTVWRVPFFPDQSLSQVRRAASYLSFAFVAAVIAPFVSSRPDVVWVYHGPFTTGLASLWFRVARRARLVITAADLWPESLTGAGVAKPGRLTLALRWYSKWINSFAHHIICSNEGIARRYAADGVPAERLSVIPVWIPGVEQIAYSPPGAAERSSDVVYAGNLGPAQQLDTLVRAAEILLTDVPAVRIHVFGTGASERVLKELAEEIGATNVHFHGRVSATEAFERSAAAAVQVVSLRRSPEFRGTVPSKLSLCFAAGTPFVYGLEGDAAKVAQLSGGGVAFDPGSAESLAEAIRLILRMTAADQLELRRHLRRHYEMNFTPAVLLEQYARLVLGESGA